jgi:hypothetical protein
MGLSGIWRRRSRCIKNGGELSDALVAHTCNPSYSGGRNQEDCGSAWANSS